jgi:hypothetical protein
MKATTRIGSLLFLYALAGAPDATPLAAQDARLYRLDRVTVEHAGTRVFVHVTADGVASALGEPEVLGDRTRLSLTLLRTTLGSPMPVRPIQDRGLLDTSLQQRGDDVVLTVDAVSIGDYGLEPRAGGVVLWFEPAPEPAPDLDALVRQVLADAGVAAPAAEATAVPAGVTDAAATAAVEPGPATGRTLRAGVADFLVASAAFVQRRLESMRIDRGPLLMALPVTAVALILLAMLWWMIRRHPRRTPEPALAPVSTGEAFAWAARTLRSEGLDVGGIAQRTGIARDAVQLLLADMDPANPAAPGSPFRPSPFPAAGSGSAAKPISH